MPMVRATGRESTAVAAAYEKGTTTVARAALHPRARLGGMSESGGTPVLRAPANQVSPRAIPFWTVSALIGDAFVVIPAAIAFLVIPDVPGWVGLVVLGLALAAAVHAVLMPRIRFRVHRWEVTPTAVHTREGWIGRESRIAPISRVQTVDSRQGAVMRLFGLASITVTTASAAGPITIDCLDDDTARQVVADLTAITAATQGDAT